MQRNSKAEDSEDGEVCAEKGDENVKNKKTIFQLQVNLAMNYVY